MEVVSPHTLLVVSGPTACGKSSLGLSLAEKFSGEIVNADSVQMYKDFDIGSAKPRSEEQKLVPHHLFSCLDPNEEGNAGLFVKQARPVIDEIVSRNKLPIVVGGSGLYVRALLHGLPELPSMAAESVDAAKATVRDFRTSDPQRTEALHAWLREVDPESAAALHAHDKARIERALIVALSSGKSIKEFQKEHRHTDSFYKALVLILLPERSQLYQAIDHRVEQMFAAGLVSEVQNLASRYPLSVRAFGAIGYRHVRDFMQGAVSEEAACSLMKQDTRRFAKRQTTWWRNQPKALKWRNFGDSELQAAKESGTVDVTPDELSPEELGDAATNIVKNFLMSSTNSRDGAVSYCVLKPKKRNAAA